MTSPANAHYSYVYHGNDFASVDSTHTVISVCNQERDGNSVEVHHRPLADSYYMLVHPDTTEDGVCRTVRVGNVAAYRLCERNAGCTAWRWA